MNIRFLSIELQNFRSIDRAKINLADQGIVIVKGINEYENNATSNGSGKSSIFEGIIYALFEETSSGEKDVENRIIANGFTVVLEFEVDGNNYKIQREGKKGKTTVILFKNNEDISARNKSDTNKLILDIFGISKSIFLDSIFLSQNAVTNLASLAPTARRERLEVLTNTDYVINVYKDKIKEQQLLYESKCVDAEMNKNKLIGNKDALEKQKLDVQKKIDDILIEIERLKSLGNIKEIEQEILQKENLQNECDEKINQYNVKIENKELEISQNKESNELTLTKKEELDKLREEKRNKWNEIDKQINNLENDKKFKNQNKERINKEINDIKNSDKCPTCGRKYDNVDDNHIIEIISTKTKELENEDQMILSIIDNISTLQQDLKVVESAGKTISGQIDEVTDVINKNKEIISNLDSERKTLINEKDNIYKTKENLQNDINILQNKKEQLLVTQTNNIEEFKNMLKDIDEKIIKINEQIEVQESLYNQNNDIVNTSKHILQLITKEFRTYLLQNSLKYLNKVLKEYSLQLFSNDGDVIRINDNDSKLDIQLGSASYESLSGGERTRVNIALLLAQKSLANMIGNINCNLIILDEILGYCDSQAEINVINLITKELESLETIYMVSHKEIPIGYDSELIVVKDKSGLSRIKSY